MTQEELKKLVHYDPETGIFTRISGRGKGQQILSIAKSNSPSRPYTYVYITLGRKFRTAAHRLAFLYMTGELPLMVDHIDRNPLNNKWDNLRLATKQGNAANTSLRSHNKAGYTGVSLKVDYPRKKPYRAIIFHNGKQISLGTYYTAEDAARAYDARALELFGEFACLNFPAIAS